MSKVYNKLNRTIYDSLSFLENKYIRSFIIVVLVVYIAGITKLFTPEITALFNSTIGRIISVLLVIYFAHRDPLIAILIAVAFVMSTQNNSEFMIGEPGGIVGYNAGYYPDGSCVNCAANTDNKQCDGLGGNDRYNAQGLGCPVGYNDDFKDVGPYDSSNNLL